MHNPVSIKNRSKSHVCVMEDFLTMKMYKLQLRAATWWIKQRCYWLKEVEPNNFLPYGYIYINTKHQASKTTAFKDASIGGKPAKQSKKVLSKRKS